MEEFVPDDIHSQKFELKCIKISIKNERRRKLIIQPVPTCFCCTVFTSFAPLLLDGKTCTCLCPGKIVAAGIVGWFDAEI